MSIDIKRIDIKEFREKGYLQELNRQFLHPLGLALEVVIDNCPNCDNGTIHRGSVDQPIHERCPTCGGDGEIVVLGGIWDFREDPEGLLFGEPLDEEMIAFVKEEREKRSGRREELLAPGRIVQEPQDLIDPSEVS